MRYDALKERLRGVAVRFEIRRVFSRLRPRVTRVREADVPLELLDAPVDGLTGLATSRQFHREIEQLHSVLAADGGGRAVLVLVDVDGLKVINDMLGHRGGDAVLIEVANRLRRCVGEKGVVARLGGDESAVLIRDSLRDERLFVSGLEWAVRREPILAQGEMCSVEVSAGWAMVDGSTDPSDALRRADEQMYLAKRRAGSDPFDRVAELVVGLLGATGEGIEQALASGVAEVAGAELAFVDTPAGETLWPGLPDVATAEGLRALARSAKDRDELVEEFGWKLGVPLRGDGAPIGAFAVSRSYPFAKPDRIALSRSGVAIGQALLRLGETEADRRRISELEDLAFRDENTGLANRRALLAALAQLESADQLSLLFLDFDGLRAVNNELSYEHGNELLRTVAACIERSLRENEFAARLHGSGGDEFIIVCPGIDEAAAVIRAAQLEQELARVELPPEITELYGGASAGYAVRVSGEQPLALVDRAATLMRERKRERKTSPAISH